MPELKINWLCPIAGLICIMGGCNHQHRMQKELIGVWSNLDLQVSINHNSKTDSVYNFVVPEGEWESTLNMRPILTEFREDGTYSSEYRNLQDSLIRKTEGTWKLFRDTLILVEEGTATRYHTAIENSEVTFSGWLDWDQDGEVDDLYTGKQVRVD